MQVAKVMGPGEIRLAEATLPSPGRGEVLVRVRAVGICGSDLQYYAEGRIGDHSLPAGHILGHEVAGVIEALGPEAEGPEPGTPVAVDPAMPCGQCRFCLTGDPNFCRRLRFFGSPPTPGALQEYLAHPAHLVLPLPAAMPFAVGATLEPLGVAIHAVDLGHLGVADRVVVFGCGPIGLLIARLAQLSGAAQVVAVEPLAHRRAAAGLFGASAALDPSGANVAQDLRDRTGGEGADVVFEAAGSEEATAHAVEVARPGATLVFLGYWKADRIRFPGIQAMRKGLTLRFVRRMKRTFPRALDLVERGQVDLPGLISHQIPFAEVADAFRRAERRGPDLLKTVLAL